ncbi:cbb3-type cytochrome c oxidase subunit II, partial [Acinetobacter baumannii]
MATNIFHGHKLIERHVTLLAVLALLTVAIGGLVEIAPLFWIESTVRHVDGIRPYTPL